jgi:hypothetical protein
MTVKQRDISDVLAIVSGLHNRPRMQLEMMQSQSENFIFPVYSDFGVILLDVELGYNNFIIAAQYICSWETEARCSVDSILRCCSSRTQPAMTLLTLHNFPMKLWIAVPARMPHEKKSLQRTAV